MSFEIEFFQKLLISIALGGLIGIERESREKKEVRELIAGVRTFTLISLLGFVSSYLSTLLSEIILLPLLFAIVVISVVGYWAKVSKFEKYGLTTTVAFLIAFCIGLISFFDTYPFFTTVSIGLLTALILAIKEYTRKFSKSVLVKEVRSAIIFFVLTFVITPLIPNYYIDPLKAINPFVVWMSMIFVLSLSFMSYVGMKLLGARRGIYVTGFLGGLVSSTATSVEMGKRIRESFEALKPAVTAVGLACIAMCLRVLMLVCVADISAVEALVIPLLILIGVTGLFSSLIGGREKRIELELKSPLTFSTAINFTLLFTLLLFFISIAKKYSSETIYLVSLISGFVELDAITLSLSTSSLPPVIVAKGILLAIFSNTLTKWMIVGVFGRKEAFKEVAKIFIPILLTSLTFFILL